MKDLRIKMENKTELQKKSKQWGANEKTMI